MRFFPCVTSHVHNQHVLSLERFLVPGAAHPAAHEGFFAGVDVVRVYVLHQVVLRGELQLAFHLEQSWLKMLSLESE